MVYSNEDFLNLFNSLEYDYLRVWDWYQFQKEKKEKFDIQKYLPKQFQKEEIFKRSPSLSSKNYLILVTSKFQNSLALSQLIDMRQADYNIIIVNVEGLQPSEIKQLIVDKNNQVTIANVLIVGGEDIIPMGIIGDNDYVDINYNGRPDIPLGRLPFTTEENLQNLVDKISYYESSKYYLIKKVLFIAGSEASPATGFKTATYYEENLIDIFNDWEIDKAYFNCGVYPECYHPVDSNDFGMTPITINKINQGNSIIYYSGHGGNQLMPWRYFPADDFDSINNLNKYGIFVSLACSVVVLSRPHTQSSVDAVN